MRIENQNFLSAPVTLNANRNFKALYIGHIPNFAIQLVVTATVNGAFKLQGSCDPGRIEAASDSSQESGVTNWTDIASTSTNVTTAGTVLWNVADAGYLWVRVVFTDASSGASTGQVTAARFNGKGI